MKKGLMMTAMKISISEVMETMFFLPVEFGEQSMLSQCGMDKKQSNIASQLDFTGDVSGKLCILAPEALISQMTENFMGEPQERLTREHLLGTFTEMLNMVGGNALSKIDSKVPFELGIPIIIDESDMQTEELFTIIETIHSKMVMRLTID